MRNDLTIRSGPTSKTKPPNSQTLRDTSERTQTDRSDKNWNRTLQVNLPKRVKSHPQSEMWGLTFKNFTVLTSFPNTSTDLPFFSKKRKLITSETPFKFSTSSFIKVCNSTVRDIIRVIYLIEYIRVICGTPQITMIRGVKDLFLWPSLTFVTQCDPTSNRPGTENGVREFTVRTTYPPRDLRHRLHFSDLYQFEVNMDDQIQEVM